MKTQVKHTVAILLSAVFLFVAIWLPDNTSTTVSYVPSSVKIVAASEGKRRVFSANELELLGGLTKGSIKNIEVLYAAGGELYLGDEKLSLPKKLSRASIESLSFHTNNDGGSFFFNINGGKTEAQVSVLPCPQYTVPPKALGQSLETFEGIDLYAHLNIKSENDFSMVVTEKAKNGSVEFKNGKLVYSPYKNFKGKDSFSYIAQDCFGLYSKETTVEISVKALPDGFVYPDLLGKEGHYEALKLRASGILGGRKAGDIEIFSEKESIAFSDFLIALEKCVDIKTEGQVVSTGIDGDSQIDSFLKPYVAAALQNNILKESFSFPLDNALNTGLALTMMNGALNLQDVRTEKIKAEDAHLLSGDELQSLMNLIARGVVPNSEEPIGAENKLSRIDAAIYLSQILNILQ